MHYTLLGMNRADGLTDGLNTIQGMRTYDSNAGTWTTPDAYGGNVHDPASQKSYMWNNNNPVTYSDPTGFSAVPDVDYMAPPDTGAPPDPNGNANASTASGGDSTRSSGFLAAVSVPASDETSAPGGPETPAGLMLNAAAHAYTDGPVVAPNGQGGQGKRWHAVCVRAR